MTLTQAIRVATDADGRREPRIAGTNACVASVISACHEMTIDAGLAHLGLPGLDRTTLEPVLIYCAQERCIADEASCTGCRRRTEAEGIVSFDDFVARHREILVGDGTVRVTGSGRQTLQAESLKALSEMWSGEKYWYWARRVIRKLRHGIRRAQKQGEAFAGEGQTPAVILMEPQLADNIGMVARAMANFGLDTLRLIVPRDGWPNEKARIAASGANFVIDEASAFASLGAAIGDLNWLAATTARQRDLRKPVMTPLEAVGEMRARIGRGERCGVLFGRERSGLSTAEVSNADALVMIPVNSHFASLNLAQAVLILGYDWMRTSEDRSLGRVTNYETPISAGLNLRDDRLATKAEVLGLFEHLEAELERLGFFNPPQRRPTVVRNLRTMLSRMSPTENEVRTLRGIVATLAKGKGRARK